MEAGRFLMVGLSETLRPVERISNLHRSLQDDKSFEWVWKRKRFIE